jgi:hypothetical protein
MKWQTAIPSGSQEYRVMISRFWSRRIPWSTTELYVHSGQHGRTLAEIMTQATISSARCAAIHQVSGQE